MPEQWRKVTIMPLYKDKESCNDCCNYRGISLLTVPGKIYVHFLNERMMMITERKDRR